MAKNGFLKNLMFFLAGMFSSIFLFVFFVIFLVGFIAQSNVPIINNNSYIIFDFSGEIVEHPVGSDLSFFNSKPTKLELIDILRAIENASYDSRISGIIINGDLTNFSKSHIEEITRELDKFKESGKDVIAWFSDADNNSYDIALSASKIYMPDADSASLTLKGYYQTLPYLKDAFDKIGLEFNVIHIGSFKGTGENFVRNNISNELASSYLNILKNINQLSIERISKRRGISIATLKELYATGKTILMTPKDALSYKLIDGVKSYEDIFDELSKYKTIHRVSVVDYINFLKKQKRVAKDKIAILYIEGTITNYYNSDDNFSGSVVGAKSIISDINRIKNDETVKAVILRINSPGGSALASELILQELIKLKKEKPLYVSFGPIAASGGYYISCAGDKIFTTNSTITGSIGVVSIFLNHKRLNEKIGVNFATIKENKMDDFLTSVREPSQEEIMILKNSMFKIYEEFTSHVVKERNIPKSKIPYIAEGRVWTGSQSNQIKLTDEIGGLRDTIEYAIKNNKISSFMIDSYPKPLTFFEKVSNLVESKSKIDILERLFSRKELIKMLKFYKNNGAKPAYILPDFETF